MADVAGDLINCILLLVYVSLDLTLRNRVSPLVLVLLDLDPLDLLPRLLRLLLLLNCFNLNLVYDVFSLEPQMRQLHVLRLLLLS